jgi:hypothetical protein
VDKDLLELAMHQCFTVDCDGAHRRASQIAPDSPLRTTDDFHAIEYRYQVNRLLAAEAEGDVDKRRAGLEQLKDDPKYEVGLREAASRQLARLGGGKTFELEIHAEDAGAEAGRDGGDPEAVRVAELMRSRKPDDYQAARAIVEPRIYNGHATVDDVRVMTTICKAQKDEPCLRTLRILKL